MRERDRRLGMQRAEEFTYGQKLQQSIENQLADERRSLERQRVERLKYKEELEKQIEDTNKRKLYKDVMSEYERKLNGMDLLAYENLQAELHSGLSGPANSSPAPNVTLHNTYSRCIPAQQEYINP